MNNFIERLPLSIQNHLKKRFLRRKCVKFSSPPSFAGEWPEILNQGEIHLGQGCFFRSFRLKQHISVRKGATLEIGNHSFFNDGVNICATKKISIGEYAKIGDMVYIYDTDFHEISPMSGVRQENVHIGRNVWIGTGSIILPGAHIGDHCVIGAGSIVSGSIPARSVAAGTPARVVATIDAADNWVRR